MKEETLIKEFLNFQCWVNPKKSNGTVKEETEQYKKLTWNIITITG